MSAYDQAELLLRLINHLGIASLRAIAGASYGGMVALAFGERFPDRVARLIVISAADRAHPMASAWRVVQRRIVKFAIETGNPAQGLELARALAMATYRSPEEFAARFAGAARRNGDDEFVLPVEEYLFARGAEYAQRYRPDSFVCLSESIDLHRVDAGAHLRAGHRDRGARRPARAARRHARHGRAPAERRAARDLFGVRPRCLPQGEPAARADLRQRIERHARDLPVTNPLTPDTRAVRAGLENCDVTGAVVPPLHLSSTYAFRGFGDKRKYDYSRSGNPTRDLLADALADLEGGAGAVITGSGMGAITLVGSPAAGGRARHRAARLLWRHVPPVHRVAEARRARRWSSSTSAMRPRSRPRCRSRPRWCGSKRPAIRCCASPTSRTSRSAAHAVGALVVADNTFLSPGWQQPLALGADIVVHSTTKYINGHSDVVGGAVIAAKKEVAEQLAWWGNCLGLTGSAFDSYLTLRGLRTLHVRLREHGTQRAGGGASSSPSRNRVKRVYFPGLPIASGPRDREAPAVRIRRHRHARSAGRRRRRASVSPKRSNCSRWRSRWAASKASWRIRPR